MNQASIKDTIARFSDLNILVIGDVIIDAYFTGKVERVSPEAPVPVLDIDSKEYRLGGAANVAVNVKDLGASCVVCAMIGSDQNGTSFKRLMEEQGLSLEGIVESDARPTTIKTRLVSGFSQLLRMDEETTESLSEQEETVLLDRLKGLLQEKSFDAIIFEDYDKGTLTPKVIDRVIELADAQDIPVTVDPKRRNFFDYAGVTLFKPNLKELREGLNIPSLEAEPNELLEAFQQLKTRMNVVAALFTLSEHGVFITDSDEAHHIPAIPRNIADVSGAGDTVIATATCALAAGSSLEGIAFLSNLAGGFVCQFPGVVSIHQNELLEETSKVLGDGH